MKNRSQHTTRLDAADGYFLSNQLQKLDPTVYYHLVPGIIGRKLMLPVDAASPNLPIYKFQMVKLKGQSRKGGPRGKSAPSVSVTKTEETQSIKTLEAEFSWTVDEIKAANETGADLGKDLFTSAVTSLEQQVDGMLCLGDAESNIPGLANNALVDDTVTPVTKTGSGTSWLSDGCLPSEIIRDVIKLVEAAQLDLKQAIMPGSDMPMFDQFVLHLPRKHMTKITTTARSDQSDLTIAKFILENFDMIKAIKPWWRLDTADDGDPMAVLAPCLDNGTINPMAGGALLPLDYEQLPEQYSGRNVTVPCASKCGGFVNRYPIAFKYFKGI